MNSSQQKKTINNDSLHEEIAAEVRVEATADVSGNVSSDVSGNVSSDVSGNVSDKGIASGNTNRRKFERFPLRLRVILTLDANCFRTFTTDISENGVCLVAPVPANLLQHPCEIYIANKASGENIRFHATLIGDKKHPLRFMFLNAPAQAQAIIRKWIKTLQET